jgi:hypothetical protein
MVLEQAVENIHRFPYPAGDEVAKQGDIRVADMMVRDAAELAIAHMMGSQQIILAEFDVGPIGDGALSRPPEKRQLKSRVFLDHIAQRGLELRGGNRLMVNPAQHLAANRLLRMARGLRGSKFTGIPKDGEQLPHHWFGKFGVGARRRAEVPGIAHPMLNVLEDIEQVSLRQALFE